LKVASLVGTMRRQQLFAFYRIKV